MAARNRSSRVQVVEWDTVGPCLQSYENTAFGAGRLGLDYTDNMDSRWDVLVLGPQINTVDCGAAGGTAANSNSIALSEGMNGTKYFYVGRGTKWAKIQASNMTLISDGTETATAQRVTGMLYTKNAAGTEEIAVFLASGTYQVITTVSGGATDTFSANNETIANRVGNYGWPGNTIIGAGGQVIRHNVLTGSVGMDASAWQTRATVVGPNYTPTSIALDSDKIIIGTSNGPLYFDNDFQEFRFLIEEIANDPDTYPHNCRAMTTWFPLGVMIPTRKGLRWFRNGIGAPCGPEVYQQNNSPVQGYFTALWGGENWLYGAIYNPSDDLTYIVAGRPPRAGEPFQEHSMTWYPLAKLASGIECEFLRNIERYGGRDRETVVGGYDDDVLWFTLGNVAREIDDANYRFATAGDAYFTEMRRENHRDIYPAWFEFETDDCSSSQTVTLSVSVNGGTYEQIGSAAASDGWHRFKVSASEGIRGWRIKPKLSFATGSTSASPKVIGKLRMGYYTEPREIDSEVAEGDTDGR